MKLGSLWVAIAFVSLTAIGVYAEESKRDKDVSYILQAQCASIQNVVDGLYERFEEVPFASGSITTRSFVTKQAHEGDVWFFANPKANDGSYTLVLVFADDNTACILGAGQGFAPDNGTSLDKYRNDIEKDSEEEPI